MNWFKDLTTDNKEPNINATSFTQLKSDYEKQKEQNVALQQIIDEMNQVEEAMKEKNKLLAEELSEALKAKELKEKELNMWKQRAFTEIISGGDKKPPPVVNKTEENVEPDDNDNDLVYSSKRKGREKRKGSTPKKKDIDKEKKSHVVDNDSKNVQWEKEKSDLENEINKMAKEKIQLENENIQLTREKAELYMEKQTMEEMHKKLLTEVNSLSASLQNSNEEIEKLKRENEKLTEDNETMIDVLSRHTEQIVELTNEKQKLMRDSSVIPLPAQFNLPDTEFVIKYFSCHYKKIPGYLYICPNYVCYINNSFPGRLRMAGQIETLIIGIANIVALKKLAPGLLKRTVHTTALDIVLADGSVYTLSALYRRKEIVETIEQLARGLGNDKIQIMRVEKKNKN